MLDTVNDVRPFRVFILPGDPYVASPFVPFILPRRHSASFVLLSAAG